MAHKGFLKYRVSLTIAAVLGLSYFAHGILSPLSEDKVARIFYEQGHYGYPTYEAFRKGGIIVEPLIDKPASAMTYRRTFNVYILNMEPKWEAYGELKFYLVNVTRFGKFQQKGKMTVSGYEHDPQGRLVRKIRNVPR